MSHTDKDNPSLLILAAGMGSRYGGLKQMDGVGPSGETIMDYTLHDAIKAGFDHVVFVIREAFAEDFEKEIVSKYKDKLEVDIVFQDLHQFVPEHLDISDRVKPWGTGHAVLCACSKLHTPFAVFNADDFYGADAIQKIGDFLKNDVCPDRFGMVAYPLVKTLSDHGSVSRGICEVSEDRGLVKIEEHEKIRWKDGEIVFGDDPIGKLSESMPASMNLWGLHPSVFPILEQSFNQFIIQSYNEPKSELYLPFVIDNRLQEEQISIDVLNTSSKWLGVTYKDDLESVQKGIRKMVDQGDYPTPLWSE
jgi:choline kinase